MRKFIAVFMCLLPGLAFAEIDISGCEKIGYKRGTWEVYMCENLRFECPKNEPDCDYLPDVSTPDGCRAFVDEQNKQDEENQIVLKCVADENIISHKTQKRFYSYPANYGSLFAFTDGTSMNLTELLNDNNNIYVFIDKGNKFEPYLYLDSFDGSEYNFNEFE